MGLSLTAAFAIIGVAVVMSIELIASTTIPTLEDVHEAYDEMRDRAIDQVQTDVTITAAVWNNPNMLISVDNTGSVTLNTTNFSILYDGVKKPFTCNVPHHYPQATAVFTVPERADNGVMIKIITNNGIADYYVV